MIIVTCIYSVLRYWKLLASWHHPSVSKSGGYPLLLQLSWPSARSEVVVNYRLAHPLNLRTTTMMCAHRPSPSPQTQEPSTVCITPASSASAATRSVSETLAGDVMSIPMDSDVLVKLRHASASRRNFSANVMRKVFSKAEREVSNVRGKLGKSQLDPEKIEHVKTVTFRMFPSAGFQGIFPSSLGHLHQRDRWS